MAKIGSLTVDLTLKSAEFIRDLGKSSQAVATNTQRMAKSVNALSTGFGALFSARLIKQIASFTAESIKLAATMHGPLADSATKFLSQFEELQDTFQIGIATGFLDEMARGLGDTEDGLKKASDAGKAFGTTIGVVARGAGFVFGTLIPDVMGVADRAIIKLLDNTDKLRQQMQELSFEGMKIRLGITDEEIDNALAYGSALELAAMETEQFWSAQVTATAHGEELLNTSKAYIAFINSAGTPLEQYRLAIARVGEAQLGAAETARLTMNAQIELGSKVAEIASNVTSALATAFKENKAFAIAETVVNTAQAVMKTYAQFGGGPWGIAAAAAVAAVGAAQIATILSAQPGSGGHSKALKKASGGGSSAAAKAGAASTTSAASVPGQAVNITLVGEGGFSREQVRVLIGQINSAVGDGATLRVSG